MTVELQTGNLNEVTSASDAELYAGMAGSDSYVIRGPLEAKMSDSNTLSVGPGNILQNGRHIRLKGETNFTIPSGVQAQKRSNIAIIRTTITRDDETMQTIEKSEEMVLSGEPTLDGNPEDPELITGDLLAGDTIADFPLYRVVTDGINALDPVPLYNVLQSAAELRDSISQEWIVVTNNYTLNIPAGVKVFQYVDKPVVEGYRLIAALSTGCAHGGYMASAYVHGDDSNNFIYITTYAPANVGNDQVRVAYLLKKT